MIKTNLPVILLKGLVLLPHQEVRIELNNDISKKVIEISKLYHDDEVLIVCPLNTLEENPDTSDLPKIGVIGQIRSCIDLPNGNTRVVITGKKRVKVFSYVNYSNDEDVLESIVEPISIKDENEIEETAILRKLMIELDKYINSNPFISNSIMSSIKGITDLDKLTDLITNFLPLSFDKKINLMLDASPISRGKFLIKEMVIEQAVIALENKIENNLKNSLDKSQKDFILKEKIRLIKKELGETDTKETDISNFKKKIEDNKLPDTIKSKLLKEIDRYSMIPEMSPEISVERNYIDYLFSIPWNISTKDEKNLNKIEKKLNETHTGLLDVKERVIEYIAVKSYNEAVISPIICLVGPPGVGKTTFAESIASALNRKFIKISLGGMNDSAELIGHRRAYIGSNPGKIITSLIKCGTNNPIFLLDEIDKLTKDFRGDPASTLLDILDTTQNKRFVDNYIDEEVDLSKVFFILTANDISSIPSALYDRLEIITLSGYTDKEKIDIAKNYLLKKAIINNGIESIKVNIKDEVLIYLIDTYTKESGVRELDRLINKLIRKIITELKKESKTVKSINISLEDLDKYLGISPYPRKNIKKTLSPGFITALAYTPLGGSTLDIEVTSFIGTGNLKHTGRLGDIINESIEVSLSYIKSNMKAFNIKNDAFKDKDFHINFRENAIPKDGPSAGSAITSALLSYLLNKKIKSNISMTGEMTLNGDILPIGGLKEKTLAAIKNDINEIYVPLNNKREIEELDEDIKSKIKFHYVSNYMEIFKDLFK